MPATVKPPRLPLSSSQKATRTAAALSILGFMAYAWSIVPNQSTPWAPFISGLRSLIGLPCPLCGGTRATHYILQGDWSSALYYNWIAFPAVFFGTLLALIWIAEAISNRRLLHLRFPRKVWFGPSIIACILLVWGAHIHDALSTPKPELVNTNGIYFKWAEMKKKQTQDKTDPTL